ncbi:MAG: DUF4416 family protein [Spirochaetia bacterium]|nr:DUF4416 family protein [Spirochaetia bacterium]
MPDIKSNEIDTARFFVIVIYENENDLINSLSVIEKKIQKYDYVSPNIVFHKTALIPVSKANNPMGKIISFPKIYLIKEFSNFALNILKQKNYLLKKKKSHIFLIPGFVNSYQVAAAYKEFKSNRLQIYPNIFCQVELTFESNKCMPGIYTSYEFSENKSLAFFSDVRRLYFSSIQF